jgi:hypothetical protein
MNVASLEGLRERGWRMTSLEHLPHLCPGCVTRQNGALEAAPLGAAAVATGLNAPAS